MGRRKRTKTEEETANPEQTESWDEESLHHESIADRGRERERGGKQTAVGRKRAIGIRLQGTEVPMEEAGAAEDPDGGGEGDIGAVRETRGPFAFSQDD